MTLPPYLSRTPPPLNSNEEDENVDEEFGTFVVSGDLGEEVYEVFEKAYVSMGEDNISEDSGFCMNSCGQTQSPCDISPLSSSYPNKGNGCVNEDAPESSVLDCRLSDKNSISENITSITEVPINISSLPDCERISIEDGGEVTLDTESASLHVPCCFVAIENNHFYSKTDLDEHALPIPEITDNPKQSSESTTVFSDFHEPDPPTSGKDECELECFSENGTENIPQIISNGTLENFSTEILFGTTINSESNVDHFELNSCAIFSQEDSDAEIGQESPITENYDGSTNDRVPEDDFSDFTEFQSSSNIVGPATKETHQDFGSCFLEKDDFGEGDGNISICSIQSAVQTSIVWNCLQCFEDTSACKYQWSTSRTNMKFLKALQIDSRNIFHGPWSKINKLYWTDVPSQCDTSFNSHVSDSSSSNTIVTQPTESSIPEAHFDWVSSGLVNPLQPTSNQHYTTELLAKSSSDVLTTEINELLASLPSLSFVKAHYIVFKRD